jgi:hypothetical protein
VPLPLLLYPRGRGSKEGNQVDYNMITIRTLSLLVYFKYIFYRFIYALGSKTWLSEIFQMVGRVISDPFLDLPSPYGVVPRVPILINRFHFQAFWPCFQGFLEVVQRAWHCLLNSASPFGHLDWLFCNTMRFLKSWSDRFIRNDRTQVEVAKEVVHDA